MHASYLYAPGDINTRTCACAATVQAAAGMSADTAENTAAEAAPSECSEDAMEVSQSQDQQGADRPAAAVAGRRGHLLRHHRQHLPALHGARRPHLLRGSSSARCSSSSPPPTSAAWPSASASSGAPAAPWAPASPSPSATPACSSTTSTSPRSPAASCYSFS